METKIIIFGISTVFSIITSTMWDNKNWQGSAMRYISALIAIWMSMGFLYHTKNGEWTPILHYVPFILFGVISLIMIGAKGQNLFALAVRLMYLINIIFLLSFIIL